MTRYFAVRLYFALAICVASWGDTTTRARSLRGEACINEPGQPERCIDGIQVTAIQEYNKWILRPTVTGPNGSFNFNQFGINTTVLLQARIRIDGKLFYGQRSTTQEVAPGSDLYVAPPVKVELRQQASIQAGQPASWSGRYADEGARSEPDEAAWEVRIAGETTGIAGGAVTIVAEEGEGFWRVLADSNGRAKQVLSTRGKYTAIFTAPGHVSAARLLEWSPAGWLLYEDGGTWERSAPVTLHPDRTWRERIRPIPGLTISRHDEVHSRAMDAIPFQMVRSVDTLALLEPGVAPAPDAAGQTGPGIGPGVGSAGQFSTNGLRSRENAFAIDGADNNDEDTGVRRQGYLIPLAQAIESLDVFQTFTSAYDARYGRALGAQVNIVSKSGGDRWHGSLFGFLSDGRWNARDYFAPGAERRAASTTWQSGAAIGGPVGRQGSFVMGSLEHVRRRASNYHNFATPTIPERGLFGSGATGLPGLLFPLTLAGNAVFSLFPFPNNPSGPYGPNTYTTLLNSDADGTLYSAKFDQALWRNRNVWLMARFNGVTEDVTMPSVGRAMDAGLNAATGTQNLVTVLTNDFGSGFAHAFRFAFGRTDTEFDPATNPRLVPSRLFPNEPMLLNAPLLFNLSQNGVTQFAPLRFGGGLAGVEQAEQLIGPIGELRVAGFSTIGADTYRFPQDRNQRTLQFNDLLTWVRERNTLQAGVDIRSLRFASVNARNARPMMQFHGMRNALRPGAALRPALSPLDTVASGAPAGLFQTLGVTDDFSLSLRRTAYDFFVHNEFRWTRNFLLTAGLRVNVNQLPNDLDDRLALAYTPDRFATEATRASQACNPNFLSQATCRSLVDNLFTQASTDLQRVYGQDRVGMDPRAGFAWDVGGRRRVVLRGGAGIYTGPFVPVVLNESRSTFPSFASVNVARPVAVSDFRLFLYNPASEANAALRRPGSLSTLRTDNPTTPNLLAFLGNFVLVDQGRLLMDLVLNPTEPAPGLRNPQSYHYHFTIDTRVTDALSISHAYVGTMGRHLLRAATPEGGAYRTTFNAQFYDAYPGSTFPEVIGLYEPVERDLTQPPLRPLWYEGTANSTYHSYQIDFRWQPRRGPQLRSAFTWSHAIDDASDFFDLANGAALPQNSFRRSERGSASYDTRVRSVTNWTWDLLPRSTRSWFSGAQWSGIMTLQGGQPYTVNSVYDWNSDGNLTDRLDTTSPLVTTGDRRVPVQLPTGVDPATLLAAPGQDGRVGRNTFLADARYALDSAVTVSLYGTERWKVRVRGEAYNILNRAQFGIPVRLLEAPAFGASTYTTAPNRTVQLALKVDF